MAMLETPPGAWIGDLNGDGVLTIADAGPWLGTLFFVPGNWAIWALAAYAAPVARFLELDAGAYDGVLAGFVSALVWLAALLAAALLHQGVRSADEALTGALVRAWAEAQRQYRVAVRRIKLRRASRSLGDAATVELAEEIELSADELRTLRLHGPLEPGDTVTASDVAARLAVPRDRAARLCARLAQLRLLAAHSGRSNVEPAYALTAAGQALLVFRTLEKRSSAAAGPVRARPLP